MKIGTKVRVKYGYLQGRIGIIKDIYLSFALKKISAHVQLYDGNRLTKTIVPQYMENLEAIDAPTKSSQLKKFGAWK